MLSAAVQLTRQPVFNDSLDHKFPVVIERRSHPFPFRTRQLSSASPMILRGQLCGKVGRRRDNTKAVGLKPNGLFLFSAERTMIPRERISAGQWLAPWLRYQH